MYSTVFSDVFFLLSLLVAFSAQLPATIFSAYLAGGLYLAFRAKKIYIRRTHLYFFIACMGLGALCALTFNHNLTPVFYLLLTPLILLFASDFSENKLNHIFKVLMYVTWIFIGCILALAGLNWHQPEPLGAILPWASTNGLPSYLLVVQIAYSITYYLYKNRLPLPSSLATFCIALIGLGRGSIIVASLLILFSFSANFFLEDSRAVKFSSRKIGAIFLPLVVIYLFYNWTDLVEQASLLIEASKFSAGIIDEHRSAITKEYLAKLDIFSVFFGADYSGTVIVDNYGGNPHNSYIRIHSFYGAASILALLSPLALILTSSRINSQKFIVTTLIAFSLLRAYSEPIFFPSTLDFFYFLYFFIFFRHSRRSEGNPAQVALPLRPEH